MAAENRSGEAGAVKLHDLPPYLRAALLSCVRHDAHLQLGVEGSVRLAEPRQDRAPYLVTWDRHVVLTTAEPGADGLAEMLEAYIAAGGIRREAADLFVLVVLLAAWDDAIRELGLYSGRVYLASEDAVGRLFDVAGADRPDPEQLHDLLLEAQSLELIYRFPVAYKFRRTYGFENQCRLNGWGRRLARRAIQDQESLELRDERHANLKRHLRDHFSAYDQHIQYVASEGLATAPADSFTLAARLPVPILL